MVRFVKKLTYTINMFLIKNPFLEYQSYQIYNFIYFFTYFIHISHQKKHFYKLIEHFIAGSKCQSITTGQLGCPSYVLNASQVRNNNVVKYVVYNFNVVKNRLYTSI